jgi:ATP phosphoribosyltransferase
MEYVSAVESVLVQESQVASLGMRNSLSIALPKGRLLQPSIDALEKAGLQVPGMDEIDRRLVYDTGNGKVRFILVRPADVFVY